MRKCGWYYLLAAGIVFGIDRLSKSLALVWCMAPRFINNYVSCAVSFNRGVSFSLFHSEHSIVFFLVSLLLVIVTTALTIYAWHRWRSSKMIWGETLLVAGSWSNIYDRVRYGGVIDFIECSYDGWVWPSFNMADAMIVCGVIIMYVYYVREQ